MSNGFVRAELTRIWGGRRSLAATAVAAMLTTCAVAWPGGELPLLIEGCSFKRYVTMQPGAQKRVADIGTVFQLPIEGSEETWWLSPDAIPGPGRRGVPLSDASPGGIPGALAGVPRGQR